MDAPSDEPTDPDGDHDRPTGRVDVSAALVDAARRMLIDTAPNALTVREIAAEAGVNHGLVHRHFGSKLALFRAVVELQATELVEALSAERSATDDVLTAVETVSRASAVGRVLAWTLAEGVDATEFDASYRLIVRARDLLDANGVADAAGVVALLSAAAFGWSAFEQLLVPGLADGPDASEHLRSSFLAVARRLLESEMQIDH